MGKNNKKIEKICYWKNGINYIVQISFGKKEIVKTCSYKDIKKLEKENGIKAQKV